jgi:hypothetical protein
MNLTKTCLAVLVGFVLGAYFYHPFTVRAAQITKAPVLVLPVGGSQGGAPLPSDVQVVGFSCVNEGQKSQCYLAVR